MLGSYFVFCWQINDLQLMLGCSKVLVLRIQDLAYYLYIYIYICIYIYMWRQLGSKFLLKSYGIDSYLDFSFIQY